MTTKALEPRDKLQPQSSPDPLASRLLIAFVRELVRMVGSDCLILSMAAAARQVGVSQKQAEEALAPVLHYQKRHSPWPEGFMP